MNILLIQSGTIGKDSFHLRATANATTASVLVQPWGLQVVCENSSHRVWRRSGKHFPTTEKALSNYRSGEMKAIIGKAVEMAKEAGKEIRG